MAARLEIQNHRWAGVPFLIRTGKCLAITATEVRVRLKRPTSLLFDAGANSHRNEFCFGLSPDVFLALTAQAKLPGEAMIGEDVRLVERRCRADEMEPYERLLGDAMRGDQRLFASQVGVEAAWRVVDGILKSNEPVFEYDRGSWGPAEGAALAATWWLARADRCWGSREGETMEMMAGKVDATNHVRLVVADVDGTLVTPDKILTPRARAVVRTIIEAGIAFTITSGRPPLGMKTLIEQLYLRDPITAFNGGLVVRPDLSVIREHLVSASAAQAVIDILTKHKLDVWVYGDNDWYVTSRHGPHVDREEWTVRFPPTVVSTYEGLLDRVVKIVGVSDDDEAMARCVTEVQQQFGQHVSAALSQPYYLDVTHPKANKGEVVSALSALLAIPTAQIATIGDMPNDVLHVPAQRGEHRHG